MAQQSLHPDQKSLFGAGAGGFEQSCEAVIPCSGTSGDPVAFGPGLVGIRLGATEGAQRL
tara:strand:+ start:73 stop:252 length:180 start_codon:yes stop_codon:yes gene_type:complete